MAQAFYLGGKLRLTILTPEHFSEWKTRLRMALVVEELERCLEEDPPGPEAEPAAREAWEKKDRLARGIIMSSVSGSYLSSIRDAPTAKEMYATLVSAHRWQGPTFIAALRQCLYSAEFHDGECMRTHIGTLTDLFAELQDAGCPVCEAEKINILLSSLPEDYDPIRIHLMRFSEMTFNKAAAKVLQEDARRKGFHPGRASLAEELAQKASLNEHPRAPRWNARRGEDKRHDGQVAKAMQLTGRSPGSETTGILIAVQESPPRASGPRCYGCNRMGHRVANCPNKSFQAKLAEPL